MLDDYLQASIGQLLERARGLQKSIARPKAREFHALWQLCRDQLNTVILGLDALLKDPRYKAAPAQSLRLRDYKRRVKDLDLLENVAFAALIRANLEDEKMTRLVGNIAGEITYPLIPPVVSCQSQFYFQAYPLFNLLSVPQKEVDFLLHLPDLHHELGHFVLVEKNNPQIDGFRKAHEKSLADALTYIFDLKNKPSRGPKQDMAILPVWESCWVNAWMTEFYCDVFGVCSSGPAYGWAHLHLCTKRGGDPFHVERSPFSSHPADEARMIVILDALTELGHGTEAAKIEQNWKTLLGIGGYKAASDFVRCYDRGLLKAIAKSAVSGYRSIGCVASSSLKSNAKIYDALNEAWDRFWSDPSKYAAWEKVQVPQLLA